VVKAAALPPSELAHLGVGSAAANILSATLGNIVGGAVLVGMVYWFVYLWSSRTDRHPDG
jgi:formate/nitrite transporter FocA (FNT family)